MQDTNTDPVTDVDIALPVFDSNTPGEDIIKALKELEEGDARLDAARGEFISRARLFNIDDVAVDLFTSEPFYGAISRRVNKVRTMRVPTAAVTIMNDLFVMLWNASFFTRISPDAHQGPRYRRKAKGVLIHEFLHLALEHVMTRSEGMKHPLLANWAFDLAINCMIKRDYLPDGLLVPGEELQLPEDAESIYRPEDLEQYKKLGGFIKALPVHLASELYYEKLLQFIEKNAPEMINNPEWGKPQDQQGDPSECPACGGSGTQNDPGDQDDDQGDQDEGGKGDQDGQGDDGGDQPGGKSGQGKDPGDGKGDGQGDKDGHGHGQKPGNGHGHGGSKPCPSCQGSGKGTPSSVKNGYGKLGNFDSHEGWDRVSDAEREFIKQRMKSILRDAVNDADNHTSSNGWGSIPSELQSLIRKLVSDQVDWRALLRQFVGYSQHVSKSTTLKRINRRYPYIHPGTRRSRGATLWLYIDQSGSVSDEAISLLFGELDNLAKRVNFRVYFFDTEIDEDFIDWKRGQKHPAQRHRMGGTDFDAATAHADKHAGEMDGVMILTDGECSKPKPCRTKRGWIIVPGSKLLFETDELVIQMTNDGDKAKVKGR